MDIQRQEQLKVLAAQADARWAAKGCLLDAPGHQREQPVPALRVGGDMAGLKTDGQVMEERQPTNVAADGSGEGIQAESSPESQTKRHPLTAREQRAPAPAPEAMTAKEQQEKEDPWKNHTRGGPSEDWQPQAWDPNALAGSARR